VNNYILWTIVISIHAHMSLIDGACVAHIWYHMSFILGRHQWRCQVSMPFEFDVYTKTSCSVEVAKFSQSVQSQVQSQVKPVNAKYVP